MSKFSVENFLFESAEKFRRGTVQSFKIEYRKNLCFIGLCHIFPSKSFCLKVRKNFVEEPFSLSIISGIEKLHGSKGYVTILRLKIFVSQCPKIS